MDPVDAFFLGGTQSEKRSEKRKRDSPNQDTLPQKIFKLPETSPHRRGKRLKSVSSDREIQTPVRTNRGRNLSHLAVASAIESQRSRKPFESNFMEELRTNLVEDFYARHDDGCCNEALGFFEGIDRNSSTQSTVLIKVRSGGLLARETFTAFNLDKALNKLAPGVPVQFFFLQRAWGLQLVFVRALEPQDDPIRKLHKLNLQPSGPIFPPTA